MVRREGVCMERKRGQKKRGRDIKAIKFRVKYQSQGFEMLD